MPGLNRTGTDIADDMAYGYGFKSRQPVYTVKELQEYKKQYKNGGFDESAHALFSNAKNFEQPEADEEKQKNSLIPGFPVMEADKMRVDRTDYDLGTKLVWKRGKAIYGKKDIDFYNENFRVKDNVLFKRFKELGASFSDEDKNMEQNIISMIDKFERNEGGVYESDALKNKVADHPSTKRYCAQLEEYIRYQLNEHKGDISKLNHPIPDFRKKNNKGELETYDEIRIRREANGKRYANEKYPDGTSFSLTPQYSGGEFWDDEASDNRGNGLAIALGDIWATEVIITDYKLNEDKSYNIKYQVTLWDHFGLDIEDMKWYIKIRSGFTAWFILQHFRGYKPFFTRVCFQRSFKGKIEKNKL